MIDGTQTIVTLYLDLEDILENCDDTAAKHIREMVDEKGRLRDPDCEGLSDRINEVFSASSLSAEMAEGVDQWLLYDHDIDIDAEDAED